MKRLLLPVLTLISAFAVTGCAENIAPPTSTSWLASAAVATVLATVLSSWFNYLLKDKEYKNEYYKKVIEKRLKAIEAAETFGSMFIALYSTNDNLVYHAIFIDDKEREKFNKSVDDMGLYNLWYSNATIKSILQFSKFAHEQFAKCRGKSDADIRIIGVNSYEQIMHLRIQLESGLRDDMASLHEVEEYFKAKSITAKKDLASLSPITTTQSSPISN